MHAGTPLVPFAGRSDEPIARPWRVLACVAALAAAGCGDAPLPSAPGSTPSTPGASRTAANTATQDDPRRPLHERFTRLGARVPGFAGFVLNDDNTAVIALLTDVGQEENARIVLPPVLRTIALPGPQTVGGRRTLADLPLTVRPATFSWRQLDGWSQQLAPMLQGRMMQSLDVRATDNRVIITVAEQAGVARLSDALPALGIPAGAVVLRVGTGGRNLQTLSDPTPTMYGGFRIEHTSPTGGICTAGYLAGAATASTPAPVIVTAAHCTAAVGVLDGGTIYQPFISPGRSFGGERADRTPFPCVFNSRCRYSDAAYINYYPSSVPYGGTFIARTTGAGRIVGSTVVTSPAFDLGFRTTPVEGLLVSKVGYNTGWTAGAVTSSNFSYYDAEVDITYLYNATTDFGCSDGDSGSPVFTTPPDAHSTVGSVGMLTRLEGGVCVFPSMRNIVDDNGSIEEYSGG